MSDVIRMRGRSHEVVQTKKNKKEKVEEQEFGRSPHFVESHAVPGQVKVSAATGDTVCVGPFRFAKFDVEFSTTVLPEHRDEAYQICEAVVDEIVDRELASLRGIERSPKSLSSELEGDAVLGQMTIRVEYGCTIPTGRFESTRVSVGATEMVADGEDLEVALTRVQSFVERRIIARKERVLRETADSSAVGT